MEELQLIWGWQPALYLFLGGVGAGAFLAAGILVFMDRERHRTIAGASMWAAIACLGVGLLLLLSELTNPCAACCFGKASATIPRGWRSAPGRRC